VSSISPGRGSVVLVPSGPSAYNQEYRIRCGRGPAAVGRPPARNVHLALGDLRPWQIEALLATDRDPFLRNSAGAVVTFRRHGYPPTSPDASPRRKKRIARLDRERIKLVQIAWADGSPLDLLKTEQCGGTFAIASSNCCQAMAA
jgi:hypothetical protein